MGTKSLIYKMLKYSNDYRAIKKGRIGRRVGRRVYGKATGKWARRLFG